MHIHNDEYCDSDLANRRQLQGVRWNRPIYMHMHAEVHAFTRCWEQGT